MPKKSEEAQPESQAGVDWQPNDPKTRAQGETAEQIIAKKSEDQSRGDAYRDSFVLQMNKIDLADITSDQAFLRGMAQQVINRALFKGLHAKAEPVLEGTEVVHTGLKGQSVKFLWAVKVIPAVLDYDPSKTVDRVQAEDEERHRDPVVSHDIPTDQ